MNLIVPVLITGIGTGCFYALVALGLQVTYSTNRMLNFAQGDIVVGGMFAMWTLDVVWHVPPFLALILLLPIGFAIGVLFELAVFRPLAGRPILVSSLGPVGAGIALRGIYQLIYGSSPLSVPPAAAGSLTLLGTTIPLQQVFVELGLVASVVFLYLFIRYTWTGRAMHAVADNSDGAAVVGIDRARISMIALGISGAVSALAGGLMAPLLGVSFDAGVSLTLIAFVAAVVGGLDSALGITIGGLFVGLATATVAAVGLAAYTSAALFVVLLVAMLRRPAGLTAATGSALSVK